MKKIIFILLLFVVSGKLFAQTDRWIYIASQDNTDNMAAIYYDSSTIEIGYKETKVWIKSLFTPGRYVESEDKTILSTVILYSLLCQERKVAFLSINRYYSDGTMDSMDYEYKQYDRIIPESVGEVIYNAICK